MKEEGGGPPPGGAPPTCIYRLRLFEGLEEVLAVRDPSVGELGVENGRLLHEGRAVVCGGILDQDRKITQLSRIPDGGFDADIGGATDEEQVLSRAGDANWLYPLTLSTAYRSMVEISVGVVFPAPWEV